MSYDVVFDACTLILLAKAGLLESFLSVSKIHAAVPREVAREACEEKQSVDSLVIQKLIDEKRINVEPLPNRLLFDRMRRELGLGLGEAEAIALAVAKKARLVATDDRNAVNACKFLNMPFVTALGILTRMYQQGVLDQQDAISKLAMLEKAGRYKKNILSTVRSQLGVK